MTIPEGRGDPAPTKEKMTYNPEIHHRRSIRLKDYDYSQAGAYFVTVCAWNRECLFGEIKNGEMFFNELGDMVMKCCMRALVFGISIARPGFASSIIPYLRSAEV